MKTTTRLTVLFALAAALAASVVAADKLVPGPKGGRLLEAGKSRVEFRVTEERKAEATFYDANLQPIAPGEQVITVVAEPPQARQTLELEKTATGFLSRTPLPDAAEPYRVVVQVRAQTGAKPHNFRIDLHLGTCAGCKLQEYACICTEH